MRTNRRARWAGGGVAVLVMGGATVGWAQDALPQAGNSPAENVAQRGAVRPGLRVQQGLARHRTGPEISRQAQPDPEYRINLANELFRNLFAQLSALINLIPDIIDGGTTPPPGGGGGGVNDIVMTEIAQNGTVAFVELLNRSPIRTSLSGFRFSDGTMVSPALPPLEIERNVTLVVQLGGETQNPLADILLGFRVQSVNAGELALYDFTGVTGDVLPIENADFMVDYVQWSDTNLDRDTALEVIASEANLWTTVDFIRSSLQNMTFELNANAEGRQSSSSNDFTLGAFEDNSLGIPGSQMTETPTETLLGRIGR